MYPQLLMAHCTIAPHPPWGGCKIFRMGALVSVNYSKTKQKGSSHKIPISKSSNLGLCPVYWLEKIFKRYPGSVSDFLFSTKIYPKVNYSLFNKSLKMYIVRSKIKGKFSTHSLRRGGTTSMRASGVPLSHIKERGSGHQIGCINPLGLQEVHAD